MKKYPITSVTPNIRKYLKNGIFGSTGSLIHQNLKIEKQELSHTLVWQFLLFALPCDRQFHRLIFLIPVPVPVENLHALPGKPGMLHRMYMGNLLKFPSPFLHTVFHEIPFPPSAF